MVATEYRPSPPMSTAGRLAGRLVVSFAIALVATAALTWWMSAVELSKWWLVAGIGLPAGLMASWCTAGRGQPMRLCVGAALAIACALIAWRIWVPVPVLFTTLRANVRSASATAQHVIDTTEPGTCRTPTPDDLGPLAALGPWAQVCVEGPKTGGFRIYDLTRPADSNLPSLSYDTNGLHSGGQGACWRHIVTGWYAHTQAGTGGSTGISCPYNYQLEGGG
jgi:hypothetical protein